MKEIYKRCINLLVFIFVLALTVNEISVVIAHPDGSGVNRMYYKKWFNIPKETIDVLAIGSSTVYSSINPTIFWNEFGISSFVMANDGKSNSTAYWFLKKILKKQSPKFIFIEVRRAFEPFHEKWTRNIVDNMPFTIDKAEYLLSLPNDKTRTDNLLTYFFPIVKWHTRWKHIQQTDIASLDEGKIIRMLTGFDSNNTIYITEEKARLIDSPDEYVDFDSYEFYWLEQIIMLSREKGIELILYSIPSFKDNRWNIARHNTMTKYAEKNGITYFDFAYSDVANAAGIEFKSDLRDTVHMNNFGAEKVSFYLAKYITANYNVPDRRSETRFEFLKERQKLVSREENIELLKDADNLEYYLNILQYNFNDNYTVFFSVKQDATRKMNTILMNEFKNLGFNINLSFENTYQHSFLTVYQNGKVIYEICSSTEALEYRAILPDKMKYYIKSAGYKCGSISSIIIDGKEYSKNSRGLNIVVYDNLNSRVVDTVCWDTYKDAGKTFKR